MNLLHKGHIPGSGGRDGRGGLRMVLERGWHRRVPRIQEACRRPILLVAMLSVVAVPAAAHSETRESLGVFGRWGAFQDAKPLRCYAIAEPEERPRGAAWSPFAAISQWPGRNIRNQVHIRLRKAREKGTPVTLSVDGRSFAVVAGGADIWAADPQADAAIVAAVRGGGELRVQARGEDGRRFTDVYALRGAATAIDAAALACANIG